MPKRDAFILDTHILVNAVKLPMLGDKVPESPMLDKFLLFKAESISIFPKHGRIQRKYNLSIFKQTNRLIIRILPPSEQVTPVHEYSRGKQGSPIQLVGGLRILFFMLSRAITTGRCKMIKVRFGSVQKYQHDD